jgi:hypothetical protein
MGRSPLFLERRSYRRRRMMDGLRMLPFLGLGLWLVPLLWPRGSAVAPEVGAVIESSVALRYVFGVWAVLILGALFLWYRTRGDASAGPD